MWRAEFAFDGRYGEPAIFERTSDGDGDGVRELAVSIRDGKRKRTTLWLLCGASGELLWSVPALPSGISAPEGLVADAGDLDRDGVRELALGLLGTGNHARPSVRVYSSAGRRVLLELASGMSRHIVAAETPTSCVLAVSDGETEVRAFAIERLHRARQR